MYGDDLTARCWSKCACHRGAMAQSWHRRGAVVAPPAVAQSWHSRGTDVAPPAVALCHGSTAGTVMHCQLLLTVTCGYRWTTTERPCQSQPRMAATHPTMKMMMGTIWTSMKGQRALGQWQRVAQRRLRGNHHSLKRQQ